MLDGVISDLLRRLFGPDVADWPSTRLPDEIRDMPPAAYDGIDLDPGRRGTRGAR